MQSDGNSVNVNPSTDHFSVICEQNEDGEIEILTPLGAASLSGRTVGAVVKAVREQRVKAPVTLMLTEKEMRFIDLTSAMDYWKVSRLPFYELNLAELRRCSFVIENGGFRYRVLHAFPPVYTNNYGVEKYGLDAETDVDERTG